MEAERLTLHGAVIDFTERFDGVQIETLQVDEAELARAEAALDPRVRNGLERAIENVRRVGEAGLDQDRAVTFDTHSVTIRTAPVERAVVYVPGGRAPYPSTVVMGVVTAQVAGVPEIAVCSPPPINAVTLATCRLTGVKRVYQIGGAQAIAALAYGTESVMPVESLGHQHIRPCSPSRPCRRCLRDQAFLRRRRRRARRNTGFVITAVDLFAG